MDKSGIKIRLYDVLRSLGIKDPSDWADFMNILVIKAEFLHELQRYDGLLKKLFSSRDRNEFNSYAFEAAFAYDFESKGNNLLYEVKTLPDSLTSVDYCYETDKRKVYFELRVINQKASITKSIDAQLDNGDYYEVLLEGKDEQKETARIQSLIFRKCQDENGRPIKFSLEEGSYNVIVAYVSDLHLTMIDRFDCELTMYGDAGVSYPFRRGIFGLCQQLPVNPSEDIKNYYEKFKHFRETIHGVLFVKNVSSGGDPKYFVGLSLQYYLLGNNNLLGQEEFQSLERRFTLS